MTFLNIILNLICHGTNTNKEDLSITFSYKNEIFGKKLTTIFIWKGY